MLRLVIALVIAAPMLSGCIVISTDKPETKVVRQDSAPAN